MTPVIFAAIVWWTSHNRIDLAKRRHDLKAVALIKGAVANLRFHFDRP